MDKNRRQEIVIGTSQQWTDIAALAQGFIPEQMAAGELLQVLEAGVAAAATHNGSGQQAGTQQPPCSQARPQATAPHCALFQRDVCCCCLPAMQVTMGWSMAACCACRLGCASALMPAIHAGCLQASLQPATPPS